MGSEMCIRDRPFSTQRTRTKIAAPKSLCDHLRSTDISERKINVCNGLATGRDQKFEENSHFLDSRLDGGRAAKVQKAISGPTDCSGKGQSHFQGHCRRRSHYSKIAYCQCTGDVGTYRMCLRASTTVVPQDPFGPVPGQVRKWTQEPVQATNHKETNSKKKL